MSQLTIALFMLWLVITIAFYPAMLLCFIVRSSPGRGREVLPRMLRFGYLAGFAPIALLIVLMGLTLKARAWLNMSSALYSLPFPSACSGSGGSIFSRLSRSLLRTNCDRRRVRDRWRG